jgi:hypothetical protein
MCRAHPIVRALRERRSESVAGGNTVGPAAGDLSIYTLRHGHDHRGGTWFDAESKVVWLLAAGRHRSGEPDDAFQHFKQLAAEGRIYPDRDDIEDLEADRGEEFIDRAGILVPNLITEAQAEPGTEVMAEIGSEAVACVVHVVETAEERYFSVSGYVGMNAILVLKVLFAPDRNYEEWRDVAQLPTRHLDHARAELCFAILLDSAEDEVEG